MEIESTAFISLPANEFRSFLTPELVPNPMEIAPSNATALFGKNMTARYAPGVSFISLPSNHYRSHLNPELIANPVETNQNKQLFTRVIYEYLDFSEDPNAFRDGTNYSVGATVRSQSSQKNREDLENTINSQAAFQSKIVKHFNN
jgi:hypothetical protein